MPGPAAQHPDLTRRRNGKDNLQRLTAPDKPTGPTLPRGYTYRWAVDGQDLDVPIDAATRDWWNALRRSPLAGAWDDIDWLHLRLTVLPLMDRFVAWGDLEAKRELRLEAAAYGLRPKDRNALKWVIDPAVVGPVPEARAAARRPKRSRTDDPRRLRVVEDDDQ